MNDYFNDLLQIRVIILKHLVEILYFLIVIKYLSFFHGNSILLTKFYIQNVYQCDSFMVIQFY